MKKKMNPKEYFYSTGYKGSHKEVRHNEVIQILKEAKGGRLLDIGSGDGSVTLRLKKTMKAKEVYAIDIAHKAVVVAKRKGIEAYQLDVDQDDFPFDTNYFDVIYCGELIEHLFNPDHLLGEIHRVLKPTTGMCIISTPNLAGWPNRFALLLGYQPYPMAISPKNEGLGKLLIKGTEGQWGHIRVMVAKAFRELCKRHHLKINKLIGCPVTINAREPRILLSFVRFIDKIMARFPSLSTRIIAILRKE